MNENAIAVIAAITLGFLAGCCYAIAYHIESERQERRVIEDFRAYQQSGPYWTDPWNGGGQ